MKKILLAAAIIFCAAGLAQAVVIDDFTQDRNLSVGRGLTAYPATLTDSRIDATNTHIIGERCDITFIVNAGNGSIPAPSTNPYLNYFIGSEAYEGICWDFDENWNYYSYPCPVPAYPASASYNSDFGCRALWTMEYGKNANINANLLAVGGTKIQIEVKGDLYSGPRPVPCTITLISGKGSSQQATAIVTQNLITLNNDPNIISFNYSAFTGINFSDVDYIKVEMSMLTATQDAVDYCINWIKTDNVPEPPTAITLSQFKAIPGNGQVTLQWSTETENDNAGFNVLRAEKEQGEYVRINPALIPAQGSSTQGAAYQLIDNGVQNRTVYYYKLEDIDMSGATTQNGPVKATPRLLFGLFQ